MFRNFFKKPTTKKKEILACNFFYRPSLLSDEDIQQWIDNIDLFITPLTIEGERPFEINFYKDLTKEKLRKHPIYVHINGKNLGRGKTIDTEYFWINYPKPIKQFNFNFISLFMRFNFDKNKLNHLNQILNHSGIIGAFIYDYDYIFMQSLKSIGRFKSLRGKKMD